MAVPTLITELSTTAASNAPSGSDSPATLDDIQRAHAAFIAQLRDNTGFTTAKAAAGANSDITSLTGLTTPLSVAQGGTGAASNAATAYALKGANADITSLTGLTTPLSMAQGGTGMANGFVSSLASSGYQKLPSGLIIQWGTVSVANAAANATNSATFPIAFPTAVYSATANMVSNSTNGKSLGVTLTGLTTINLTNDPAGVQSGTGAMFIAIGL